MAAAGPLEMSKNRVQAGLVQEPMLQYTVSGRGLRDTAPFLPTFMLASVPHDFAELMLYFHGHNSLDVLPEGSWLRRIFRLDATLCAAAGACAVGISHPADCIKPMLLNSYAPQAWDT